MPKLKISFFLGFLLSVFSNVFSQAFQAPETTLESPHNTMLVHLYYLQPESYQPELAARAFFVPEDSSKAEQLAIQLKQVLDGRGLFVRLNMLPQENDYLDSLTQKPFYTPFPDQLPDVYLEKINDRWYYSPQSIKAIPTLHRELYPFGTDFLVKLFPDGAQQKFLELATWQWAGMGILLLFAWILQWLMSRVFRPLVRMVAKSSYSEPLADKNMLWKVARLASFVVLLWLLKAALPLLQLPVQANGFLLNSLEIATVFVAVWLGLSIVDVVMQYAFRFAAGTEHKLDEQLIPILRRMLKILLAIGGIIYILQLLDVNVTALIAGVSIGGLALALAAQDTVKNLIGSAMIFFDKPFQIGDWIVAGSSEGEVVEVGFRSTKIQPVDSSIIAVPNSLVASAAIKNLGIRRYRMFKTSLGITYDTPPMLIEIFLKGLRRIIEENSYTKKDNYLVYLNSFGDSSLNIYFRTHMVVETFAQEMQVKEDLVFNILRLAEALGVRFAYPTQTLFVEEIPGKESTTPAYEHNKAKLEERMERFFEK